MVCYVKIMDLEISTKHTGSCVFRLKRLHTLLLLFCQLKCEQQQRLNHPFLDDTQLVFGMCQVQMDTRISYVRCNRRSEEIKYFVRHLRNKFMEVGQWGVYVNDMGPIAFLYHRTASASLGGLKRFEICPLNNTN